MNDHHLGVSLEPRVVGVDREFAEPRPERLVCFDRDVLIPKDDDLMLRECIGDGPKRLVTDRGQIDAFDLRPDRRGQRADGDGSQLSTSVGGNARPLTSTRPVAPYRRQLSSSEPRRCGLAHHRHHQSTDAVDRSGDHFAGLQEALLTANRRAHARSA